MVGLKINQLSGDWVRHFAARHFVTLTNGCSAAHDAASTNQRSPNMATANEMRADGYTVEQDREMLKLFQHGEYVASLSPLGIGAGYGFDWHRADQWHLRSHDVTALAFEIYFGD